MTAILVLAALPARTVIHRAEQSVLAPSELCLNCTLSQSRLWWPATAATISMMPTLRLMPPSTPSLVVEPILLMPTWTWAVTITIGLLLAIAVTWLVAMECNTVQTQEVDWTTEIVGQVGRLPVASCGALKASIREKESSLGEAKEQAQVAKTVVVFSVFLSLYMAMNIPIAFLSTSPVGQYIGFSWSPLVFASYPLGTCVALPLPALLLPYLGDSNRLMTAGLAVAAVGTLMFGLLGSTYVYQSLAISRGGLTVLLVACRGLAGVGAALAEGGAFTLLLIHWPGCAGKVIAAVEVVIGFAGLLGTILGGVLYEVGQTSGIGGFLLPYVPCIAIYLLLLIAIYLLRVKRPPAEVGATPDATGSQWYRLVSWQRLATAGAVLSAAWATEAPCSVIGIYLSKGPFFLNKSTAGLYFAFLFQGSYVAAGPVVGWLVDRWTITMDQTRARRSLKMLMVFGSIITALGYAIFGPLVGAVIAGASGEPMDKASLLAVSGIGMVISGVGMSFMVIPSQPEMLLDVPVGLESANIAVAGLWNGVFQGGVGFGSLMSGLIFVNAFNRDSVGESIFLKEFLTQKRSSH